MTIADAAELPRYQEIGNILMARIVAGVYPIGALLPTEIDLCEEFGVSRYTIREALRRLTDAGLVRRRQGSGSQVVADRAASGYVHTMRSLSELFQYAADTVFRVTTIEERVPEAEFAPYFGAMADRPFVYVEGVRLDQDGRTPIAFSRVFINPAYAAIVPDLKGFSGAIYRLIEQRFGVAVEDVEQEIRAEPMGKHAARQLGSTTRVWAVRVIRRYFDGEGNIIQVSVNYHAADRFSYTMHLRREGSKGWA